MSEGDPEKKQEFSLDRLKAGERGVIQCFKERGELERRLMELGLVPGTEVLVKRFAPLGDPMELVVRGYHLSLRKEDAAKIMVKRMETHGR